MLWPCLISFARGEFVLNLLHVVESLGRGGAEQALVNVLPEIVRRGHTVGVAALWEPSTLATELEAGGVSVHRLGLAHRWALPHGTAALRRLLNPDVDVVHTHLYFADVHGGLAAVTRGVPTVSTLHNLSYELVEHRAPWLQARKHVHAALLKRCRVLLGVSRAVAASHERALGLAAVRVLPNAVPIGRGPETKDSERERERVRWGLSSNGPLVVVPARVVPEKGHTYLLAAVAHLIAGGDSLQVACAGGGPELENFRREAEARGVAGHVRFLGDVPHEDLLRLFRAADVAVVPSVSEGLGLGAIEAQAAGLPVVATDVGGLPEVVEDGVTGFLVPPGNPAELADALRRVLNDPSVKRRFGRAGRERVATMFSISGVCDALEEIYTSVLVRS